MPRRDAPDLDAGNDRRCRVYVLRLRNGDLYVGSTAQSINQRYAQHCDPGHRQPAKPVKRHGVARLEAGLCLWRSYPTRAAAIRAERRLAERLRQAHPDLRVYQG